MMAGDFSMQSTLIDVFRNLLTSIGDFLPRLMTAVVVILLGVLVAKIAERVLRTAFDKFGIDDLLGRAGVNENLQKFGLRDKPGRLLSRTVYFLLLVLFTQSVTRAVGLDTIADAIGSFFAYLPNLVAAFLVLLLGMIVSGFLGGTVARSAEEAGIEYAAVLGRLVGALVLFVVIIMAISQLRIDTDIIKAVVLVLLAGFALAVALTFGLGTREITRNMVAGFYARKMFASGETIRIRGERGTLVSITPLQTIIDQDGATVSFPNRIFLDEVIRR